MISEKKDPLKELRVCSFNVNGVNTLFNYHPWSGLKNLDNAFDYIKSDVITLQELKISQVTSRLLAKKYRNFVTIPKLKKGYSGVGVYVRKPTDDDSDFIKKLLTVVKAEEGITGSLPLPSNKKYSYRDAPDHLQDELIGGYPTLEDNQDPALDLEGRCILVELGFDIVVISLYCPANSLGTEEMELFRLKFLRALIERCRNLVAMGKNIIVMGDINVSRDLIDSDEYIKEGIKLQCVKRVVEMDESTSLDDLGKSFELLNKDELVKFRSLTELKRLINSIVIDDYFADKFDVESSTSLIFYDTLRQTNGRRLKMYTCWNTLKNFRSINSGSRIDHIFVTPNLSKNCHADIWNQLMGSDHCPIYCDINLGHIENEDCKIVNVKKLKFEANHFYGVDNGGNGIDRFFAKRTQSATEIPQKTQTSKKLESEPNEMKRAPSNPATASNVYKSRKKPKTDPGQLTIKNFFFKSPTKETDSNVDETSLESSDSTISQSSQVSIGSFKELLNSTKCGPPNCLHGEPATLRRSQKPSTKGKKFWCCSRSLTSETFDLQKELQETNRCNFFKWASK